MKDASPNKKYHRTMFTLLSMCMFVCGCHNGCHRGNNDYVRSSAAVAENSQTMVCGLGGTSFNGMCVCGDVQYSQAEAVEWVCLGGKPRCLKHDGCMFSGKKYSRSTNLCVTGREQVDGYDCTERGDDEYDLRISEKETTMLPVPGAVSDIFYCKYADDISSMMHYDGNFSDMLEADDPTDYYMVDDYSSMMDMIDNYHLMERKEYECTNNAGERNVYGEAWYASKDSPACEDPEQCGGDGVNLEFYVSIRCLSPLGCQCGETVCQQYAVCADNHCIYDGLYHGMMCYNSGMPWDRSFLCGEECGSVDSDGNCECHGTILMPNESNHYNVQYRCKMDGWTCVNESGCDCGSVKCPSGGICLAPGVCWTDK